MQNGKEKDPCCSLPPLHGSKMKYKSACSIVALWLASDGDDSVSVEAATDLWLVAGARLVALVTLAVLAVFVTTQAQRPLSRRLQTGVLVVLCVYTVNRKCTRLNSRRHRWKHQTSLPVTSGARCFFGFRATFYGISSVFCPFLFMQNT